MNYQPSRLARLTNYFRKYTQVYVGFGMAGLSLSTIIPHTLGIWTYKSALAVHQDGEEKPISDDMKVKTQSVSRRFKNCN